MSGDIDIMLNDNKNQTNLNQFPDAKTKKYLAESLKEIVSQSKSLLKKRNADRSSAVVQSNIFVKADQGMYYTMIMKHNCKQSYQIKPEE